MIVGFVLLLLTSGVSWMYFGEGRIGVLLPTVALAWLVSVFLTDKYVHKYPRRYFSYLIASHLKAAVVMACLIGLAGLLADPVSAPQSVLWAGFFLFVFADFLASAPRRDGRKVVQGGPALSTAAPAEPRGGDPVHATADLEMSPIDAKAIIRRIRSELDGTLVEFIENHLPDHDQGVGGVIFWDQETDAGAQAPHASAGLLVSRNRLNNVRRLNRYLLSCASRLAMGGYMVARYTPLEHVARQLKEQHAGWLYWPVFLSHFIWHRALPKLPGLNRLYFHLTGGKTRVLSKAEVWGRLAYCGMRVIAESDGDAERVLIARRASLPARNPKPSYYPVVALEKVGLDGKPMYMHKIRTMYPYSEFLQQRIFEDHGLASTGKFANDFRLTEYGSFLRRYWLDELPQLFDWLRGEVKLVGMRATSRQFLSLYPREVYDLYVQVKPGLIPPIFDESTKGLDMIAEVELDYLRSYCRQPVRTDARYLLRTVSDIVIRGVRSR